MQKAENSEIQKACYEIGKALIAVVNDHQESMEKIYRREMLKKHWEKKCPAGYFIVGYEHDKKEAAAAAKAAKEAAAAEAKIDRSTEDERLENVLEVMQDIADDNGFVRVLEIGQALQADGINTAANRDFVKGLLQEDGIKVAIS